MDTFLIVFNSNGASQEALKAMESLIHDHNNAEFKCALRCLNLTVFLLRTSWSEDQVKAQLDEKSDGSLGLWIGEYPDHSFVAFDLEEAAQWATSHLGGR